MTGYMKVRMFLWLVTVGYLSTFHRVQKNGLVAFCGSDNCTYLKYVLTVVHRSSLVF